jgi:hypothetical protein
MAEEPHYERYKAFGDYHNALFTPDGIPATQITVLRRRWFGALPETRFPALVPPTD